MGKSLLSRNSSLGGFGPQGVLVHDMQKSMLMTLATLTPDTLHSQPYAAKLAAQLNADDEEGWTYLCVLHGEKAYVLIVDANGEPVGTL